jgi:hypothetical protein
MQVFFTFSSNFFLLLSLVCVILCLKQLWNPKIPGSLASSLMPFLYFLSFSSCFLLSLVVRLDSFIRLNCFSSC